MRRVLVASALALAACTSPTSIHIDPMQPVLKAKTDRIQLVGHVMTGNVEDARALVKWTSDDPTLVTVDDSGHIAGLKSGRASVTASYGKLKATVPVEVSFVEGLKSDMGEVSVSYAKGDPMQPKVEAVGYDGRVLKDRSLYWTSKDAKICRVDPSGQIWPVEIGETDVVGAVDDKSITIHCTVTK